MPDWIGRIAPALLGLTVGCYLALAIYRHVIAGGPIDSLQASQWIFDAWAASWLIAAAWSRRTAGRPPAIVELLHWAPTGVGFVLFAFGSIPGLAPKAGPLWRLSVPAGWTLAALCAAGLLFTWWARVTLGSLWSGSISRKDDHRVIETGPYRWVRHPIYTGLIVAILAQAIMIGMPANLLGALLMLFGFWLKARYEERFLAGELGPDAYGAYRRRTPMLIPFWPGPRITPRG